MPCKQSLEGDTRSGKVLQLRSGADSYLQRWEGLEGCVQLGAQGILGEQIDQIVGDGIRVRAGDDIGIGGALVKEGAQRVWLGRCCHRLEAGCEQAQSSRESIRCDCRRIRQLGRPGLRVFKAMKGTLIAPRSDHTLTKR